MPSGQAGTTLGNDGDIVKHFLKLPQSKLIANKLYTGMLSNHAIQATLTHGDIIDSASFYFGISTNFTR